MVELKCPKCGEAHQVEENEQTVTCECGHEFAGPALQKRVFISYGHDKYVEFAVRLAGDLRARGHLVWFDKERLHPGADFEAYIEEGLEFVAKEPEKGRFVLVMTPHSVRRPDGYCLNELTKAFYKKLKILPVMLQATEPPLSIIRLLYIDARNCITGTRIDDSVYKQKFALLLDALEHDKRLMDQDAGLAMLSRWLRPLNFDYELSHYTKHFIGREWVFDRFEKWLKDPDASRLFWLTGKPGSGKTAFAINLANRHPAIKAWHICRRGNQERSNPRRVVENLIYNLAALLVGTDYMEKVAKKTGDLVADGDGKWNAMDAGTLFEELVVRLLPDAFDEDVVFVIDGLDEAGDATSNDIADFIAQYMDDLPSWFRLVVTSRDVPAVTSGLNRFSPFILDTDSKENIDDIREYLRRRVPRITDVQVEVIVNKSEGLFIYVEFVVKDLLSGSLTLENLDEIPQGLPGLYKKYFKQSFPDLDEYETKYLPVFECFLAAREPLGPGVMKGLFGWNRRNLVRFVGKTNGLVGLDHESRLVAFHTSLKDWLGDIDTSYPFGAEQEPGHERLADWTWQQYQDLVNDPGSMPGFALNHILHHQAMAKKWDRVEVLLTDIFFLEAQAQTRWPDFLQDAQNAIAAHPKTRPEHKRLKLLLEAMQRDATFVGQHINDLPHVLFQELYNLCWWYDHPRAKDHYEEPETGWQDAPWDQNGPKCHELMDRWLEQKGEKTPGFEWLRSRRPPKAHLDSPLVQVFQEGAMVRSVDWSPDGKYLAIAARNRKLIRVRNLVTGKITRIKVHKNNVYSVSWSPDSRFIAIGADKTVRVLDAQNGDLVRKLKWHEDNVNTVSWSPDGRFIASGSHDKTVQVWEANNGKRVNTLMGHTSSVYSVSWSPDGQFIASGSDDKTVRVWDAQNGEIIRILKGHEHSVHSVSWSPDGRFIASGSGDTIVRMWDTQDDGRVRSLKGHEDDVKSVSWSPDGQFIASGSYDRTVRVWDIQGGRLVRTLKGHESRVYSVSWSPDGRLAASVSRDKTVRVWAQSGGLVRTLKGHEGWVTSISWSPDGRFIASGSWDKTVHVWGAQGDGLVRTLKGHEINVTSVSWSPDSQFIASGSWDKTVRVWDAQSGGLVRTLNEHKSRVYSVSWTRNGRVLISQDYSGKTIYWDTRTWQPVTEPNLFAEHFDFLIDSKDTNLIIKSPSGQPLAVWPVKLGHVEIQDNLVIGADGSYVAILGLEHGLPACPPYTETLREGEITDL